MEEIKKFYRMKIILSIIKKDYVLLKKYQRIIENINIIKKK